MFRRAGGAPAWRVQMAELELTGKLLIAMPGMGDPRFERAVVFMCSHGEDGGMGLIINKPAADVHMSDLFEQLELSDDGLGGEARVYYGGPVEGARGFVLHSAEYTSKLYTMEMPGGFSMTATLDILEDIAGGRGPEKAIMMLGYSGWGPGQLEGEIGMNGWLVAEATAELVFDLPDGDKWGAALKSLGVEPLSLSASAGRA